MKSRSTVNFRIKVTDFGGSHYYLTRTNGRVQLVSGDMTPHALSNIAGNNAALLNFELSDAPSASDAAKAVRKLGKYVKEATVL